MVGWLGRWGCGAVGSGGGTGWGWFGLGIAWAGDGLGRSVVGWWGSISRYSHWVVWAKGYESGILHQAVGSPTRRRVALSAMVKS